MPVGHGAGAGAPVAGGGIPFMFGSNHYREKMFTDTQLMDANSHEFVHNVTPGGFLRGIRLIVSATGGVIGSGVLAADAPWSVISSVSLENIDGSPILYPITGFAHYLHRKYNNSIPYGDPAKRYNFSNTINPAFTLEVFNELRDTAGVLANTDARAQYRLRYTVAPFNPGLVGTTGTATAPTLTVSGFMEAWSQPDASDLHGQPIDPLPAGLNVAHVVRHQIAVLNGASADNIVQLTNVGNELRSIILVVRDSNNARQDYLTDPIRWRLDNRSLNVSSPDEVFNEMANYYDFLANGSSTRETGVYVFPRFRRPGDRHGEFWLPTTNSTYLTVETATLGTGANLPGTIEVITDEVVPVGPVPAELEGI